MDSLSARQREERQQAAYDILLVEDDEDTCQMLTECIELQFSYRVLSFSSGEEVLQRLAEIREVSPLLFIFDLLLPGMTGLQLYDHLRAFDTFERVPTIIVSAAIVTGKIQAAIAQRDLVLLLKPFEISDLLDYIEYVLIGPPQLI